jgi:TonB family protein
MAVASIAIHIVIVTLLFSLPEVIPPKRTYITSDLHRVIHLASPKLFEATQKAPNLSKVVHPELDVRSEVEAPQSQAPRYRPPQPSPGPVSKPVPAPAPPPVIEAPKIQIAAAKMPDAPPSIAPPAIPNGTTPQAPPPPASSKPKIAFENVAPPPPVKVTGPVDPRLLMHVAPPEYTAPTNSRPSGGGGMSVGDTGDDLSLLPGINQPQTKGRMGSNLQLLSDANGFDFKPYLLQILAAVRRNWMAVIPESAKMGRRGTVLIQFIIDRRGGVPKLVIASSSGTEAFDRAAVAGVSASNPFPPLPPEFKGDQIRLQLAFAYNSPRH